MHFCVFISGFTVTSQATGPGETFGQTQGMLYQPTLIRSGERQWDSDGQLYWLDRDRRSGRQQEKREMRPQWYQRK